MRTFEVPMPELMAANRWTVSFFAQSSVPSLASAFPMEILRHIVVERRGSADPQQMGDAVIAYLGLENIRPLTGELVDFAPRRAKSIKSRSKLFHRNDVLFGRLRPELNKVYLATGAVPAGLCSGEFIVLTPVADKVLPRYLRHVLASLYVTQYATQLTRGAALPRMATEDLLNIELPLPDITTQKALVQQLARHDREVARLRARLETLPHQQAAAFAAALASGSRLQ